MTTQPNTEPLKVGEECREAFEAELRKHYPTATKLRNGTGEYIGHMNLLWQFYQAAWNRRTEPSPADVTRYGCTTGGMEEQEDGDYVLYCDYRQATQQPPATVEGGLTDEEIMRQAVESHIISGHGRVDEKSKGWILGFARAVIKADRALNQRLAIKEGNNHEQR